MYLMLKNNIVAQFSFEPLLWQVYNQQLLPFALQGNNINIFSVHTWCLNRVLNLSRSNAKKIISSVGLDQNDKLQMCLFCKGLSLTDCYWIKLENSKDTWETVNLYTNHLNNVIAHVALTGEYVSIQGHIRTPELTGGGSYAKCWRHGKDGLYLYKAPSIQGNGKEHLIEVFCSDLLDRLDVKHVKYNLADAAGLRKVSRCKAITSENISICEMTDFIGYCNRNNINFYTWVTQYPDFYKMLIVDYIMFNSDRHSGNWGILYNSNTIEILGLHPFI